MYSRNRLQRCAQLVTQWSHQLHLRTSVLLCIESLPLRRAPRARLHHRRHQKRRGEIDHVRPLLLRRAALTEHQPRARRSGGGAAPMSGWMSMARKPIRLASSGRDWALPASHRESRPGVAPRSPARTGRLPSDVARWPLDPRPTARSPTAGSSASARSSWSISTPMSARVSVDANSTTPAVTPSPGGARESSDATSILC